MPKSLTAALALLLISVAVSSECHSAPFVPGFERFARHTQDADGGELLLSELSCTACHARESVAPKRGPDLSGAGRRLSAEWVRAFVLDPEKTKSGTTMPGMLGHLPAAERGKAADALVAFLASQRREFPVLKSTASAPVAVEFWNKGDAERGLSLYHTVGCVACHEPSSNYEVAAPPPSSLETLLQQLDEDDLRELGLTDAARPVTSVPLPKLTQKYSRQSLTHFLLNPALTRPAGRMPSLKLTPAEAADIAAWLLRESEQVNDSRMQQPATASNDSPEPVAAGRALFVELRCSNCHSVEGVSGKKPAKPLTELDATLSSSCLDQPSVGLPRYELDTAQQTALQLALQESRAGEPQPDETAWSLTLRLQQLNCIACHERDGVGGAGPQRRAYFEIEGHVDLGDEGRIPPPLTGVGRKLTAAWLKQVLAGTGDVRPHMQTRMPVFPDTVVSTLPADFASADELSRRPENAVFGDTKSLVAAGRELLDTGCVQCHPVRGEQLPGVVGIDLAGIAARVHPQWFHDFLRNPAELKNRTRMPTFFPNGKSANQELLAGDVDQQIAAMWAYIKDVAKQPLPEKIEKGKVHNFELTPTDRPIVLRTFLRDAGPHGIAVGFPQKVHLAFDAEQVRVAQFWKGRFLDAHGTWFDRFTPLAAPLGTDVVALPDGVPFAVVGETEAWPQGVGDDAGYQFRGYRLDASGTPEFLYRFSDVSVRDRFVPDGDNGFIRRITLRRDSDSSPNRPVWFRALTGKALTQQPDGTVRNDAGLSATVSAALARQTILTTIDLGPATDGDPIREWRIPVDLIRESDSREIEIELRYVW